MVSRAVPPKAVDRPNLCFRGTTILYMYWSSSCKTWPTTKTDILMLYNYYLAGTGNISRHHYIWINCIFFVIMVFPEVNYHCTDLPSRLNGYSHRKPVASPNQNELNKAKKFAKQQASKVELQIKLPSFRWGWIGCIKLQVITYKFTGPQKSI